MPGPIATIGSMHICPMCSGTVPHVGGPVIQSGAPGVLINGNPIALMGDICTCIGPPDMIVQGEAGVTVNGVPVATVGSLTAHGGSITMGEVGITISSNTPQQIVTMEEADIPFPKISIINKTLIFLSGNSLKEAQENQEKLREPLYEELENIKLTSTFAVDQLQIMAKKDSLILFIYVIKRVFGNHYSNNTIKKMYMDAQANASILNPKIIVTKGGDIKGGGPAGYSNKTQEIIVSENFARKAKDDNDIRAELMVALVEEVGHHIHHLLHNVYTAENERENLPKKNRAIGDPGAKFSYQVIQINLLETSEQYFADLEIDGAKSTLIWDCKKLHNNLTQYVNEARQNRDDNGEIVFYKAGTINVNHGEYGHQDIQELAMKENLALGKFGNTHSKLTPIQKEKINTILYKIYLGNWMRDFSQVIDPGLVRPLANTIIKYAEKGTNIKSSDLSNVTTDKPSNTKITVAVPYGIESGAEFFSPTTWFSYNVIFKNLEVRPITWSREFLTSFVSILALKEFAKPKNKADLHKENYDKRLAYFKKEYLDITSEVLGVYRPDEHIDNPKTDPVDKNAHNPDLNAPGEKYGFVGQATPKELAIGKVYGMKNYIRTDKSDADSSRFSTKRTAYDFVITQLKEAQFNRNFNNITQVSHPSFTGV